MNGWELIEFMVSGAFAPLLISLLILGAGLFLWKLKNAERAGIGKNMLAVGVGIPVLVVGTLGCQIRHCTFRCL